MASKDKRYVSLDRSNHHIFWDYDQAQVMDEIVRFLGKPGDPASRGGARAATG